MGKQPPLSDDERSDLIAYLDGELDAKSAAALEAKLNVDPRTRTEADTLRRTWAMLDYLPRPTTSVTFTSRTLERVSVFRPVTASSVLAGLRGPWALGVGWAAVVVVAGTVGFEAVSWKMRCARWRLRSPLPNRSTLISSSCAISASSSISACTNRLTTLTSCANWTIRIYSETTTSW